jgi:hypothetical protein
MTLAHRVKRRTFKSEFKARLVLEELSGVKSTAEMCCEHQLKQREEEVRGSFTSQPTKRQFYVRK